MNIEYGLHSGMPMPSDRPGPWGATGHPDMSSSARPQMLGPPPFMSNQIGQPMSGQGPRPQSVIFKVFRDIQDIKSCNDEVHIINKLNGFEF
jgi:hypothetical protein